MTDHKWDDNKIDNLLGSMPDIQDKRLESDILMRLKQDERLHPPRRNVSKKWIPILAAVAALLVVSLSIPSMFRQNESAMDKAAEPTLTNSNQAKMSMDSVEEESAGTADSAPEAEAFNALTMRMVPENHILLQENLLGFQPLQLELVTDENIIVPITFLIPAERVAFDFPEGEPDSLALYNQYATGIPEIELEFEVMDPVTIKSPQPYYKMVMPSGQLYLAPYETGRVLTVEEALLAMKEVQNVALEKLVPENIAYHVMVQEGVAVITFTEPLDLSAMDQGEFNAMLEGFMLTAKDFNKQVRLENVMQDSFLHYDLTTVLPEPVGVNPTYFFE